MNPLFALNYPSPQQQAAASVAWIEAVLSADRPLTQWTPAMSDRVSALIAAGRSLDRPQLLVRARRFWWVDSGGDSTARFHALTAAPRPPGAVAPTDIDHAVQGLAIRLLRFGEGPTALTMACTVTPAGVQLLDPTSGLWPLDLAWGQGDFMAHLLVDHPTQWKATLRAFLVPMPTQVHYTWIGPPASAAADGSRPDITGPLALAAAATTTESADRQIRFHCLDAHVAAFRQLLPAQVQVEGIESQFPAQPNTALDARVLAQLRRSIRAQDPAQPKRHFVNAKNVWSFYCLCRWGGYALDTGVSPASAGPAVAGVSRSAVVSLPHPVDFGMAGIVHQQNNGHPVRMVRFAWDAQHDRDVVISGSSPVLTETFGRNSGQPVPTTDERTVRVTGATPDVWLMRSPRGGDVVVRALGTLLDFLDIFERANVRRGLPGNFYADACRSAVISAAYTGMSRDDATMWERDDFTLPYLIPSLHEVVATLGLTKRGYGSHRAGT